MKFNSKVFKSTAFVSIVLSLLVHMIFVLKTVDFNKLSFKKSETKKEKRVKIVFRNSKKPKQIVNNTKKKKTEKPKDAKFLSHSDQKHERESVAKKIGSFKEAGKGNKKAINNKTQKQSVASSKKKIKRKSKKKKKLSFSDLAFGTKPNPQTKASAAKGLKNGNEKKTGLARANDYIEELPLGDMSKLNTVEYKYYGFYFRIRQKLEQYWGKSLQDKAKRIAKSGRRFPASENHITSLTITLDSMGNIVDVFVKGTSGVSELDDAAVESFNKAGPFPNPPKGLVKNGFATIEWGFVVKS